MSLQEIQIENYELDERKYDAINQDRNISMRRKPIGILEKELEKFAYVSIDSVPRGVVGASRYLSCLEMQFPKTGIRLKVEEQYQNPGGFLVNCNATLRYLLTDDGIGLQEVRDALSKAGLTLKK